MFTGEMYSMQQLIYLLGVQLQWQKTLRLENFLFNTGCGKTSLIKYLANMEQVNFHVLNFHAGTTAQQIRAFVENIELKARAKKADEPQVWAFLDEINTCDHLSLVNDLLCHRTIDGRPLDDGVVLLAACNPYRHKNKEIRTAGLEGKRQAVQKWELVYSVNPLPETMMNYVWDYGTLSPNDERMYVTAMMGQRFGSKTQVVVDMIAFSQVC